MSGPSTDADRATEETPLFGRYRVQRLIGRGGFASVYRAEFQGDYGFRKPVALKVLRRRLRSLQELASKDFLNEARLGASIRHRNLVEFYECGRVGDRLYIAMELVAGPNLQQVLEDREVLGELLTDECVLAIALHTAHGLKALHEAAIDGVRLNPIHQDMKPGNILLSPEGQAKLSDYGIARFAADFYETLGVDGPRGSPPYMSPEQTLGERLTQASDVFSFASVICELATGHNPFIAESVEGILERVRTADVGGTLEEMRPRFPRLTPVLERCLQRDPEQRYPDATALVEALKDVHPPPFEHELVQRVTEVGYERVRESRRQLAKRPVQVFWGELPEEKVEKPDPWDVTDAGERILPDVLEDTLGGLQITAGKLEEEGGAAKQKVLVGGIYQPPPPEPRSGLVRSLPWVVTAVLALALVGFLVLPGLIGGGAVDDGVGGTEIVIADATEEPETPTADAEGETPTPREPATETATDGGGGDAAVDAGTRPVDDGGTRGASTPAPAGDPPRLSHAPIRRGIRGSDTHFTVAVEPKDRYRAKVFYRAAPGGEWRSSTVHGGQDGQLSLVIPAGPWFLEEATGVDYYVAVEGPGGTARSGSADQPHQFKMY